MVNKALIYGFIVINTVMFLLCFAAGVPEMSVLPAIFIGLWALYLKMGRGL